MSLRTFACLALVAVASGTAHARTPMRDLLCPELRRAVEAANESPAFASLAGEGIVLPGLELGCAISGEGWSRRLRCRGRSGGEDGLERFARRTAACLPHAVRMSEPPASRVARFRDGTVAILIEPAAADAELTYTVFAVPVH